MAPAALMRAGRSQGSPRPHGRPPGGRGSAARERHLLQPPQARRDAPARNLSRRARTAALQAAAV